MKTKRIASVFVAAVLVLGLLPSVALANGSDDVGVWDVDSAASSPDVFESAHQASDVAGMSALESTPAPLATTTASGTMGTCTWTLAGGVLTIAPTDGVSGEFNGDNYYTFPWYSNYRDSIASVVIGQGTSATGSLARMFYWCSSLVTVDFSNLNMSEVTDISQMFNDCYSLVYADFSGFDFSSVANMSQMFYYCSSLKSVNFSGADLSSVINMSYMFSSCSSLETVDFSGVNSSLVTNMSSMFSGCSSLSYLDLSGLTTSSLTNMSSMFGSYSYDNVTSLRTVIVGDGFVFNTALPTPSMTVTSGGRTTTVYGWWVSDSGIVYDDPSDIPSNVAATYTAAFEADTFELEAAIAAAEQLNEADYTATSWENLQTALSSAKAVLANANATQTDVGNALAVLDAAVTALVPIAEGVDKIELNYALVRANALDPANYTSDSWAVLEAALNTANAVLIDDHATQTEVDSATNALNTAIDALVPVTSDVADKTELEMIIKAVAQLDESEYTPDSWAALLDVLQAAQNIDADSTASQAEVNEMTDALLAAIDALQKLFMDVSDPSEWYYEYVYYMAELGIITGYNETTFGVGDPMTRAQLVTIMWRYCEPDEYANYNEATAKNTSGLPDVADGMYYTGAVNWAVSEGVVTGNRLADGSYVFSPNNNVSFEQMVTIVARYVLGFDGAEKYDTSALTRGAFTDAAAVSDYARGSVAWAVEAGVVTGNQNADGTYTIAPLENVARERAATVLARAIQEGLIVTE